jgi:hypothetical protein
MPSFCLYGMCHNLGSSSYQGYCNENHMRRAEYLEAKQKLIEVSSRTQSKDSLPETPPSKAPSSEPQSKPSETPLASCNPETPCATGSTYT